MPANSTWKRIRKFLNDVHLWMGLASGLVVFVVCLTGTIYTFHEEIDEFLNSEKYHVQAAADPMEVEQLAEILGRQVEGDVASVSIPVSPGDAYRFSVRKEGERRGTNYLVNQYTGEILGDTNSSTSEFFMTMFRLHRWLLLDTNIGRPIVGWSTFIFVFMVITGLIIWIPQKAKNWKQGLKIKWSGNWKRLNHDLHNTFGFYAAILLLIMGLTGLQWSFDWYRTGLRSVLGVEDQRGGRPGPDQGEAETDAAMASGMRALNAAELLEITDKELPFAGSYYLEIPGGEKNRISVRKYHSGFFASPAADEIEIHAYSGEVVSVQKFADKPLNEQIARSIKALHVGNVFGTFSKILYFISCLIATSLPVTGTIIWINKMKKKSKRRPTTRNKEKREVAIMD